MYRYPRYIYNILKILKILMKFQYIYLYPGCQHKTLPEGGGVQRLHGTKKSSESVLQSESFATRNYNHLEKNHIFEGKYNHI